MFIDFFDLKRETAALGSELEAAIARVLTSGRFILDREVVAFEQAFARLCGCAHGIGVASGTDALFLCLIAAGVGPGHEVITTANTFAATALAITYCGATPVFVDIEPESHLIDPQRVSDAITPRTKAIIPVHLYGQCADMEPIMALAQEHGLVVIEDACQAHGALYKGRPAGSLGHAAAFSFYPTKNLGAYGDAGMITTNAASTHERLCLLRNYGQTDRYHHAIKGYNSRLDELQAAILNAKLGYLEDWNAKRRVIAARYTAAFANIDLVPIHMQPGSTHVYHQYVIAVQDRDALRQHLQGLGIATLIHYPVPLHLHKAFTDARAADELTHTERRASQILSLPIHPWLTQPEVDHIIAGVLSFYNG